MKLNGNTFLKLHRLRPGLDRREFVLSAIRYPLVALLAGIGYVLVRRSQNPSAQPCSRPTVCAQCRLFAGCDLPKAEVARSQAS